MEVIDTDCKAYLLGWMFCSIKDDNLYIKFNKDDAFCFYTLHDLLCPYEKIIETDNFLIIEKNDSMLIKSIISFISDDFHKIPDRLSHTQKLAFIRACFEKHGSVMKHTECAITLDSVDLLEDICDYVNVPYEAITDNSARFTGTNAIDFLGKIYDNCSCYYMPSKYEVYIDWLSSEPSKFPECMIYKSDPSAVLPSKTNTSDVGYDLTVIKEAKKLLNNVTLYNTGIKIKVQHGLYAEVVPRSSLSKSGYMLANSIGIIDPSYRSDIYVALVKVDPDAPDLVLPFRCCQLIFRRQIHVDIVETRDDFESTARGTGGFGSTGK